MPTQPISQYGIPDAVEAQCSKVSHGGPTILPLLGHAGAVEVLILALLNLLLAAPTAWAFNNDGKTDIVWRHSVTGTNTAWMMSGTDGSTYLSSGAIESVTNQAWKIVGTGDFNRDGQLDLVWRQTATGDNVLWYLSGTNYIGGNYLGNVPTAWDIVGTGYFNTDGKIDLLWRDHTTGKNVIWFMDGFTQLSGVQITQVADLNWKIVGTGDFNNDGHCDILWRYYPTGQNTVWYMQGSANGCTYLSAGVIQTVADTNWEIVGTGYFDANNQIDLLWRHNNGGSNVIWYMSGVTQTTTTRIADRGNNWKIVGTGDAKVDTDADGLPDLWERNYFGNLNQNGTGDWDYDGRSDGQEWADGTDPLNAGSFIKARLGYWRFNSVSNPWRGEDAEDPIVTPNNIQNVSSYDGNALQITNSSALLKYRDVEANGIANLQTRNGSVRFAFKPNWQSAQFCPNPTGPGQPAKLIELGAFSLWMNALGTNLYLTTPNLSGSPITNALFNHLIFCPNGFGGNNGWHEIIATYSPYGTQLRVDGTFFKTTTGVQNIPPATIRAQGFAVGSTTSGLNQAQGLIDELETFNYPLGTLDYNINGFQLMATVSASPKQIAFVWRNAPGRISSIERRKLEETTWTPLTTTQSGYSFTDSDPNLAIGQRYEYKIDTQTIISGINARPIEYRGKIILLVDNTLANDLTTELNQLKTNLVGDGWQVLRHDVPRHIDDYSTTNSYKTNAWNITHVIKPLIIADWNSDSNKIKGVLIVGHVSVPYSGFEPADGHGQHSGAWSADIYYGDIDGIWTDQQNEAPGTSHFFLENINVAGDGKFDQDNVPGSSSGQTKAELFVGRVDFANLPALSPKTELGLLRQYFAKNHRYRHKLLILPSSATAGGFFNSGNDDSLAQIANNISSRLFGFSPSPIFVGDLFVDKKTNLWGFMAGNGSVESIQGQGGVIHWNTNLVNQANEPPLGFYLLRGSYMGDWNLTNDYLRACLSTTNYGVAAMWQVGHTWRQEGLALGDHLGAGFINTANDPTQNSGAAKRFLAILGDPTLRMQITAPPTVLNGTINSGNVNLTWTASGESGVQYFVYRDSSMDGPFTNRLTTNPITATNFTESNAPGGPKVYQVRALKLTTTGSGSFTNLSQGAFVTVN